MAEKKISIIGNDGEYLLISYMEKGYKSKIQKSLLQDNELEVVDNNFSISETLFQAWFKDDIERELEIQKEEFARTHANKFFVQFDYPLDKEGNGVSAEFFSENEETAKKEALEVYNEQFKEEAKGKMIKFIRYRNASEVAQFCIEKYGTAYPNKIECGNITWSHVSWFAMPYSPMGMRKKPYFVDPENKKYILSFALEIIEHWEKHPNPVGKLKHIHLYSNNGARKYFKKHPEHEQFREPIQKWYEELLRIEKKQKDEQRKMIENKRRNKTSNLLTPEQLELLGINFNIYEHKYQGGKAYIELKGKKLEIVPEIKVAVDNS